MANIKSAAKRASLAKARQIRNASVKSALKTQIKKFTDVVAHGDAEAIKAELSKTYKALDSGVAKGILHKNAAARKKSRLTALVNQKAQ